MNGIELIAAERQRQIEVEGWTPEHDDEHRNGEIALAAICYASPSLSPVKMYVSKLVPCGCREAICEHLGGVVQRTGWQNPWPWDGEWWKPSADPVRNLVKAGALIAAEIDRIQLSRPQPEGAQHGK